MDEQTAKQKMIAFATSEHYAGAVELLKRCRTRLTTVIGKTEFDTIVNTITLEKETELISSLVVAIEKIRNGDNTILDE